MSRVYGEHAVADLLSTAPESIAHLLLSEGRQLSRSLEEAVSRARISVRTVPAGELRQRSGGRGAAWLAAEVKVASLGGIDALQGSPGESQVVLALDGVTDPHNLGAILRSACAFGVRAVVVPKDGSAPLNDAAVRASAGAVAHVPLVRVTNLSRALRQLQDQGFWILGTDAEVGEDLWEADLSGPLVVVLGAEGSGMRPGVKKACDRHLHLTLPGRVSSLNVSVTAGIVIGEICRRNTPPS